MTNRPISSTATVSASLLSTVEILRSLLGFLTVEQCRWRPAEGEWSINEVIGHLIAADQLAFADRIRLMIEHDHPTIPAVDADQVARERQDQQRSPRDLVEELALHRQQHTLLIESLTEEQLTRIGHYAKYGDFLVSDFVHEWAYHDYDHLQQIMAIQKEIIWPHFSSTMKLALKN